VQYYETRKTKTQKLFFRALARNTTSEVEHHEKSTADTVSSINPKQKRERTEKSENVLCDIERLHVCSAVSKTLRVIWIWIWPRRDMDMASRACAAWERRSVLGILS
jgi:hypothetical protein